MEIIQKSVVNGLPDDHEVEYAGQIDATTYFVVYRPKENWNYDSFKVSMGPADNLQDVEVTGAMRYRDGGTTVINVYIAERDDFGTFFFPRPNTKGKKPTFNRQPIDLF